ncbi:hypothetical protein ABK040_008004 [Willaertia magna]
MVFDKFFGECQLQQFTPITIRSCIVKKLKDYNLLNEKQCFNCLNNAMNIPNIENCESQCQLAPTTITQPNKQEEKEIQNIDMNLSKKEVDNVKSSVINNNDSKYNNGKDDNDRLRKVEDKIEKLTSELLSFKESFNFFKTIIIGILTTFVIGFILLYFVYFYNSSLSKKNNNSTFDNYTLEQQQQHQQELNGMSTLNSQKINNGKNTTTSTTPNVSNDNQQHSDTESVDICQTTTDKKDIPKVIANQQPQQVNKSIDNELTNNNNKTNDNNNKMNSPQTKKKKKKILNKI